ncbi:MAG: nitrous oxide reductase family maturation protein NosD [Planctomycetota bacterium]|nr:MAG: nitrous oxide reductase family maturation protein NosD [Planctomycetota bacterium]
MIRLVVPITALALTAGAGAADLRALVAAASPGDIIRVPAGVHPGTVVIDKPLTLLAEPGAIIDAGGAGDAVRVTAPNVTIRGFTIRNTGDSLDRENAGVNATGAPGAVIEHNVFTDVLFGVYLRESPGSAVRFNVIGGKALDLARRGDGVRLWQSDDCLIERNTIHDGRDAVMWFSDRTRIVANTVTRGRYGLHFMYSDDNVLEDNTLSHNSVGAFLMYSKNLTLRRNRFVSNRGPSGFGVGLKDVDGLLAEDNLFAANRVGVQVDNSPSAVDVRHLYRRNVFAYNDQGVALMPSVRRNDFTGNAFVDNAEQVAVLGGGDLSDNRFTVAGRGNFWSDYAGFDRDADGIGDLPYRADSLFESLLARDSRLRLFLYSPVQQAVEAAARVAPVVRPRPLLTDDAPLMSPPRLPGVVLARGPAPAVSAVAAGAGLLALGLGIFGAMLPVPERRLREAAT